MTKKAPRARTARRTSERVVARATSKLDQLATELPGGAPARPFNVTAASIVEVRARAIRCLACDGETELKAHEADVHAGEVLRRLDLSCRGCHAPRRVWFRVTASLPS